MPSLPIIEKWYGIDHVLSMQVPGSMARGKMFWKDFFSGWGPGETQTVKSKKTVLN